jgi:hypothetical protein
MAPLSPPESPVTSLSPLPRNRVVSTPMLSPLNFGLSGPAPGPSSNVTLPSPAPSLELEDLPGGRWRRRQNPYWEPAHRFQSPTESVDLPSGVPTERVDADSIIKGETDIDATDTHTQDHDPDRDADVDADADIDEDCHEGTAPPHDALSNASYDSNASDSFFDNVLRNSDALASVFHTPRDEVERVSDAANHLGLHCGMIHRPRRHVNIPANRHHRRASTSDLKRDSSWWMVIGKDGEAVNHILEMQKRSGIQQDGLDGMPGYIGSDSELAYTPKLASFLQLLFASIIGGLSVVYGLSWLAS